MWNTISQKSSHNNTISSKLGDSSERLSQTVNLNQNHIISGNAVVA